MTAPRFIHLRLHSAYSLLEGAIPVKALAGLCARRPSMPAVALTDTGNLFAALEFSETHGQGRHPADHGLPARARLCRARPSRRPRARRRGPIVLLAQDETGFGNLMKLSSVNYLDCGAALPHVTLDALAAHADGLICLTGGAEGPLGAADPRGPRRAGPRARRAAGGASSPAGSTSRSSATPRTARPRTPAEEATEPGLVGLAYDLDLPLVATNDVQFPTAAMLRRPRRADLHRRRHLRRPAGSRAAA